MKPQLTICTVVTPLHRELLRVNVELTRKLNPHVDVRWRVVDYPWIHTRKKARHKAKEAPASSSESWGDNVELVPAPSREAVERYLAEQVPDAADEVSRNNVLDKYSGSYAHGLALQACLQNLKTRYVLVLDPDFYLVRQDWVSIILGHMARNELGFFGAPWHPRWFQKYRDFPCVHCLFVDRERAELSPDDFLPDLINTKVSSSEFWLRAMEKYRIWGRKKKLEFLKTNAKLAIREDIIQRATIGRARDTGWKVKEKFGGTVRHECLLPSYVPVQDVFRPRSVSGLQKKRSLERLFPPERRYRAPRESYTSLQFRHFSVPDLRAKDWEEFFWRGLPFGFHVRGESQREKTGSIYDPELPEILARFHELLPPIGVGGAAGTDK